MKIGLFFGSFNPVHVGHLIIAESALNETALEQIWFMVSPQNPFKQKQSLAAQYDRLRMVEDAIQHHEQMRGSNFEFTLPKPSYTIDTLVKLKEHYPQHEFVIIMGEDNLKSFHKWKNYEAILSYHAVMVYPRQGYEGNDLSKYPQISKFDLPFLDISATHIRSLIAEGKSARFMVSEPVWEYIKTQLLYEK